MHKIVTKGLRISIFTVSALAIASSVATAQPVTGAIGLDSISSEASRYSLLADTLWAMGLKDVPEPIETAQAAVAANPDSADAHLRFGLAMRLAMPEAVSLIQYHYEEALRLDPGSSRAYALIGELLSYKNDVAGTARNYQAWLALAPEDPKAHLSYAVALGHLGQLPEASAELDRSLALGPTSAAYVLRAMKSPNGSHENILADFDKAIAVGGGEARVYRWRARTRRAWGETDLALADVAKALTYAPGNFGLRQLRGEINSDAGRYDLALAEFDALIALQPGWPDLVNDRCWTRAKADVDLQKALADCDMVVSWEPDRPEALDSRGLVKLRLDDLSGAVADYDAALEQDPELATSLYGRGVAKHRIGDKISGDADLGSARSLDPEIDKQFAGFGITP